MQNKLDTPDTNNLPVDRELAQQLKLLGYEKGDIVYLRAFFHSDDPRKGDDSGRKAQARTPDQLIEIIQKWQAEGRGVYYVVNGGGHCDKDVTRCRAIFYEHDDLDKEISRELWRSLKLPEPTFQVDTGGKSIHSYWVFDQPIDPVQWKELQSDLLEYADADRALKNPSRVMRLAGAYHISPSGTFPSRIIASSGIQHSFDLLRLLVPRQKQPSSTLPSTLSDDVPLEECLKVEERHLIANGALKDTRNVTGAALARNLIGTAKRLQYLGEQFSGDPRQLFDNYCARCAPPLDDGEPDKIWESAEKDNPTATLTDDALINCIKSWRRRQQALAAKPDNNKVTQLKTAVEVPLRERIEEIISRGLKPSAEKMALLELSNQTKTPLKEIEAIAALLREDAEIEEGRDERKQEITELLAVSDNSLDLADFLPKQLADPLKLWCGWLNIPQSVALTAVLTTASTLHPVGTELVIHRAMDFSVPPILYSAVVGESGQKKSPVYKTLIKKPLRVLQNEAIDNYQRQLTQYERDLAEWEKTAGDDPKPTKPGLPVYFFTDATGEGIKTQAQETPNKAMFALIDELAGLFNSANQYRGGKGSDKQDLLSYYDGLGQTVLRSGGIKVDVERLYLSVFGGIQPDVLKEYTKDLKDPDGQWARFLFVNQPLAATVMPDDNTEINLRQLLTGCYRRIATQPQREYKLSREAFKRYQAVYNKLEQLRVNHPQPGMRAVYSKMEGAIGRLALNLHVLSMGVDGTVDGVIDTEISLRTINQAIALAEFYIGQIKMIHADTAADKGELSALLAKILKFAQTKGGKLSARDAARGINAIKSNTQAVDCFRELEAMGYGRIEKIKTSIVFCPTVDGVDGTVDGVIDTLKQPNDNTFNPTVDGVDGVDDFFEKPAEVFLTGLKDPTVDDIAVNEKKSENIDTTDIIDTNSENLTTTPLKGVDGTIDTTIDTIDSTLKPLGFSLKPGDRIKCYVSKIDADRNFFKAAIVKAVESEKGWFLGCTVEYRTKKGLITSRIPGGSSDWILQKL